MTHQNERRSRSDGRNRPVFYRSLANFLAIYLFSNILPIAASPQVLGSGVGQTQQSTGEKTSSQGSAVDEKDVRPLEQGHSVKRELSVGQRHRYRLRLSTDQFLKAMIEQQGIDVVVQISGPAGNQISEFDSERRLQGQEQVSLVAEAAGDYQLVVQPKFKGVAAGSYEIRIEELRAATNDDRALQVANKLLTESVGLYRAGKYDEASRLAENALEIRERVLGPDHIEVAAVVHRLAIIYWSKSEYAKAEPLYHRALTIRERALGPDHPDVASSLNNLANLYRDIGEYTKAELFHKRALEIREKALGPEHLDVASSLNNLANFYKSRGDYVKVQPLYQRALDITEKAQGPDHPDVAGSLNNLASFYNYKGEYAKAEPLFQRAITIYEKVLGPEHPDVAIPLNNLANLYQNKSDYEKAEPLYQRVLAIREKALGPEHPRVASVLSNLAVLYDKKGDYAKAEPLYERALTLKDKVLGPEHPDVAITLSSLASLYQDKGEYAKAEPLFQRAITIYDKVGPENQDVVISLNNLGGLYRSRGEYSRAEPLHKRALTITEKELGPDHIDVARSLSNLALLYAAKGDIAQAIYYQSRSSAIAERNLELNLAMGSERQKLVYLTFFTKDTDFTISLHSQAAPDDPQALNLAFSTLLRRKGRGLDAMANTIATLRRNAAPQDQDLFDRLAEARSQMAALILRESESAKAETYRTKIKPIEEKIENLEANLSARSADFRAQTQPVTLSAVQAALPADSALIEFVIFTPQDPRMKKTLPPRFLAYLLAAEGQPKWVDLGEAAPINRALEAWRQSLRENGVDVKKLGRAVDELVMRPVRSSLQPELGQIHHLLIAPDGSLNLIPFGALVDEENRYLIERYTISYLTSGRDLLRLQNPQASKSAPLIMANPLFGAIASDTTRGTRKTFGTAAGDQGERRSNLTRIFFRPLPGTKSEALAIKTMLPEASLLLEGQATEAAIKNVSGPRILHIATHGFFLDYQEATAAMVDPPRIVSPGTVEATPYTVQVEASPALESAQEIVKRLKKQGVDAYIVKRGIKDKGTFFRVRSGTFSTQAAAQKYGAELRERGVTSEFFVARSRPAQGDSSTVADFPSNSRPSTESPADLRLSKFVSQVKDPLLRSGLALAGANNGESGSDDGLLTALEMAGLDLLGTKLVVLSACDTGLGEIKRGEGVQGMRRALVLAGSESQVISLWAIRDELAKEVIIPYYDELRRGAGRGEGLRQVQLRMLQSRERHHPFYWAAFIQSGEWANLDGGR